MSVAGIFSSLSQLQLGRPSAAQQNIQQLGQALKSGNLTAAQSDFAALQQAFAQSATSAATTSATTTASPITQAFNQLASDLQSGNLSASQKDFSNLEQDIQNASGSGSASRLHHHHHSSGGSGSSASTSQNSLFPALNQAGQAPTAGNFLSGNLSSGNPSSGNPSSANLLSAQQAYASLQIPDSFGGGQVATESPVSMLA